MADLSKDTMLFAQEKRRMCQYYKDCIGCDLVDRRCDWGDIGTDTVDDALVLVAVQRFHDTHGEGDDT